MLLNLRRAVVFAAIAIVLTLAYAFAGTGIAQLFFCSEANGFCSEANGSIGANGSTLIGQNWSGPAGFHGRPDDSGPYAASKTSSGGDRREWPPR